MAGLASRRLPSLRPKHPPLLLVGFGLDCDFWLNVDFAPAPPVIALSIRQEQTGHYHDRPRR